MSYQYVLQSDCGHIQQFQSSLQKTCSEAGETFKSKVANLNPQLQTVKLEKIFRYFFSPRYASSLSEVLFCSVSKSPGHNQSVCAGSTDVRISSRRYPAPKIPPDPHTRVLTSCQAKGPSQKQALALSSVFHS